MIKRILLGLGGTSYTDVAIKRAMELARRFEAEVTGVTVVDARHLMRSEIVPNVAPAEMETALQRLLVTKERIEEAIPKFESACAADGIKHQIKREETKEPFGLMISLARYHDLMIFGLRSIFEYNVSHEEPKATLARLIAAGVRPIIAVSNKFRPIQKVLIAYSGSIESAKTMKRFAQLHLWPDVNTTADHSA